jgi:thiol-disulfide isomerase/thioredoxin
VVAAAFIAVLLSQQSRPSVGSAPTLPPSTGASPPPSSTGALPAFVATSGDPADGLPIPEVHGTSFDGAPVAITADGRPKLLLFLAHWCPHCQREVPAVQSWLDAGRLPAGVDLISIATAIDPNRPNYPPDAWLQREHWTPPVLVDAGGSVAARYGLSAFPYWIAVDGGGQVVSRLTGELTPDQLDVLAGSVTSWGRGDRDELPCTCRASAHLYAPDRSRAAMTTLRFGLDRQH